MNNTLLKSIFAGAAMVAISTTTGFAQVGNGKTDTTAYTVCPSASSFKLKATYATGNYVFTWTPAGSSPTGTGTAIAAGDEAGSSTFTVDAPSGGFVPGDYSYTVTAVSDAEGCESDPITYYVRVVDTTFDLAFDAGSGATGDSATICQNVVEDESDSTKSYPMTITTSSTDDITFAWTAAPTPLDLSAATGTSSTIKVGATPEVYTVTAKGTIAVNVGGPCVATKTLTIEVTEKPDAPTMAIE